MIESKEPVTYELIKDHAWEKETVTVHSSSIDFWKCVKCKASGGPVKSGASVPVWGPFLAGTNLIDLPDDCDEAKKKIAEYWEKYPANEPFVSSEV